MRPVVSSLSASLFTVSQSVPDLSLIFLESLEYFIELYLVNCILELLLSILSKRFRCSNESNQKTIRDRSSESKVEILQPLGVAALCKEQVYPAAARRLLCLFKTRPRASGTLGSNASAPAPPLSSSRRVQPCGAATLVDQLA